MTPDVVLDARNLNCPLPVLKTKKAMKALAPGALIEVLATDPHAATDMRAFAAARGHAIVSESQDGATYRFLLRRGER